MPYCLVLQLYLVDQQKPHSYLQSQYAPPRHFSGPREVRCHNCQEIGHIRTRCPYLRQYTERAYETNNTDRAKLNTENVLSSYAILLGFTTLSSGPTKASYSLAKAKA
jgi:hypothetical protein